MAFRSLSRWRRVGVGAASVVGGVAFGALFWSVAAGAIAASVIALCIVDVTRGDDAPPTDGPQTLTIDLDRR